MVDPILDEMGGETPPAGGTPPAAEKFTQEEFTQKFNEGGWFEMLPEELAKEASLAKFVKGPHSNLAKSYVNLSKSFGDRVPRPKESFNKKEWDEWNREYNPGYPKDISEYGLGRPENAPSDYPYDPAAEKQFAEMAHELGLTISQAKHLWMKSHAQAIEAYEAQKANFNNMRKQDLANLKKEWGNAAPQKLQKARQAIQKFADKEMLETMKEDQLSGPIWKFLAKVGESISEGNIESPGQSTATRYTPKEATAKAMELQHKAAKAAADGDRIGSKRYMEEAAEYFKEAVPEDQR